MQKHSQKRWTLKRILKEIAIMLLMILVISNVLSYIRKPDITENQLPAIKALLISGDQFDSAVFEGKPLLIHFWATWCPTCKVEADNIQRLSKQYNVVTFAVKSGDNEALRTYMEEREFDFGVINDNDGRWASRFNVQGYPTTFIYDASGEIRFSEVGYTSTAGLLLRMWWVD
ncbi:protein disulfide oxidoreductase [Sulfurimonas sp. HSL3-7]|uniref:protein disulfide oxidoreductase n=1 Tax=Sulfonitrofixus jiaomeiensis TaxID=3131938 RepID=UPI0031F9EB2D